MTTIVMALEKERERRNEAVAAVLVGGDLGLRFVGLGYKRKKKRWWVCLRIPRDVL